MFAQHEETVRDIETARKRLLAEGVPVSEKPNYYGGDGTAYGDGAGLFVEWLIARHGWRRVEYQECHGMILPEG